MDKYEKRRLRLMELRDTKCVGVNAVLARKIERDPSYVNRMFYPEGKNGKKRIADDLIEAIEVAFKLPRGWLDFDSNKNVFETTNPTKQDLIQFILDLPDDQVDEESVAIVKYALKIPNENKGKAKRLLDVIVEFPVDGEKRNGKN